MIDHFKSMLENLRNRDSVGPVREVIPTDAFSAAGTPEPPRPRPSEIAPVIRPASGRKGISFLVDDVVPAPKPFWLSTLGESLELRSGAAILVMPDQNLPALAAEGYLPSNSGTGFDRKEYVAPIRVRHLDVSLPDPASIPNAWADKRRFVNPLINAVHLAFSDHRPLALSPDTIWLTIVQGFGHHLLKNAEAFRSRIVSHHGKKVLCVQTLSLEAEVWPQLISQLTAQIRDNSDPFLYENLSCQFSTTTPTIKTACQIALMEGYERYFEYEFRCVCGIPKVTLEGTPEDWQRIRDRIEVLATFDFQWWTSRLAPILDQFISTAKGAPELSFWQAIYKPERRYVQQLATGWIADLFPYLTDFASPLSMHRNPDLTEVERIDWLPQRTESNKIAGVSLKSFPTGISRAPLTVTDSHDSKTPIELLGGFFGVSQSQEDGALAPIISWAVVKKDTRVSSPPPGPKYFEASVAAKRRKRAVSPSLNSLDKSE